MRRLIRERSYVAQALGIVCIGLVFAVGTAQAVHSHPLGSLTNHHSCSICSAPSMGPAVAAVDLLAITRPVAAAYVGPTNSIGFRPVITNFVRPPPAV